MRLLRQTKGKNDKESNESQSFVTQTIPGWPKYLMAKSEDKNKLTYLARLSPFQGQFVVRRLGPAMFNPRTKFEVSTLTCNEDMTGNAICKNSRFEPPFGGLRDNAQSSSMTWWKAHCRLRIELFSLALTSEALLG